MIYYALFGLHIVAAVLVTFNVLLSKPDVRSAVGWIGVAWLSPILGSVVYFIFGINRVSKRPDALGNHKKPVSLEKSQSQKITQSVNLGSLANVGNQLGQFEISVGNTLDIYQTGDEAYPAMLAAIAKAKSIILLQMYIFRKDQVGAMFRDALILAHRRGVKVQVLVDGVGSGYFFSSIVYDLRKAGIMANRFMHYWAPWHMSYLNLRNHKKLLITDNSTAFVGGMNLGGENVLTKFLDRQINDTHFMMQGPIVEDMSNAFFDDWRFTTGKEPLFKRQNSITGQVGDVAARCMTTGPYENGENIETLFGAAILTARKRIRIVTPYFLPDTKLVLLLQLASLRGVEIELIIPEKTDFFFMDWAVNGNFQFLRDIELKCFRSPMPFDHSKLFSVDGIWCSFGSPNWDARSMRLNFELLIECFDQGSVQAIDRLIDKKRDLSRSFNIGELAQRSLPLRLRDNFARLFLPVL